MPVLIVVRHSKAASPLGTPDFERPLAGRGHRDAAAAGDELRRTGRIPDHVICSTALRTRQTLDALKTEASVDFEQRAYGGDAEELLDLVRAQDGPGTLLLVGHNPSTHQLVLGLTGAEVPSFPTSATAVIEFDGGWADLGPEDGTLASLWTPKG